MKILFCGYRDWAINLESNLSDFFYDDHDFTLLQDHNDFKKITKNKIFDITILCGWSNIISKDYVNSNYTVVLHPSDLPNYAGGSPIQHQIIDGLIETKMTLFRALGSLDRGPIIYKANLSLEGNLSTIFKNMEKVSFILLIKFILNYPDIIESPQNNFNKLKERRTKDMSEIKIDDFNLFTAKELFNKIRCLQNPYPNAFVICRNKTKLYLMETNYE